jgi:hypothetical protein
MIPSNPLVIGFVALGGYFAAATLYQLASGGNVVRMFDGRPVEVGIQIIGAIVAVVLVGRLLG